jgi:hypothetical protein
MHMTLHAMFAEHFRLILLQSQGLTHDPIRQQRNWMRSIRLESIVISPKHVTIAFH